MVKVFDLSTLYLLVVSVKLNRINHIINTFSPNWLYLDLYIKSIRICVSGLYHTTGYEQRFRKAAGSLVTGLSLQNRKNVLWP